MFRLLNRRVNAYVRSISALIGHFLSASLTFVALFAAGWLASLALHFLDSIYPFPAKISEFILAFELYLTYADSVLCILILLAGAHHFVKKVFRGVMKNEIIEGFVEGFKGGIRLGYDLVRNLLMAVPLTLYEFVNRDIPSKKSASGKPKEGGHPGRARADR